MKLWEIGIVSVFNQSIKWQGVYVEADDIYAACERAVTLGFYRNLRLRFVLVPEKGTAAVNTPVNT